VENALHLAFYLQSVKVSSMTFATITAVQRYAIFNQQIKLTKQFISLTNVNINKGMIHQAVASEAKKC